MGGIIFLIVFFFSMFLWDCILRILTVIHVPSARAFEDSREPRYAASLFSLARLYTGMQIQRTIPLPSLPPYFMIICNHQSFVDIAYLLYAFKGFRLRFVAKESLAHWIPYVSPLFRLQRHALISRSGNVKKSVYELYRLGKLAPKGYCPVVFPEGTRSKNGQLNNFHTGAVKTILSSQPMPVLCVALDGGYMISSLSHLFSNMRKTTYKMKPLRLFPPPSGKEDIENILQTSHSVIARQLETWRESS